MSTSIQTTAPEGFDRANILVEALPYIKEYENQIVVVKYGGNAMIDEDLKKAVMEDLIMLRLIGIRPVLVHGGGKDINEMLKALDIKSEFIDGLRYTSDEAMDVVQMVLCGQVNKNLTSMLEGKGIGLSGLDADLFIASPQLSKTGKDLGRVGQIDEVHPEIIFDLLDQGYIPVIASVAKGEDGKPLNINADSAASKIASALQAKKMILLTDVKGLMKDPSDESTLIERQKISGVPALIKEGIISGGMIPKIDCVVEAIRQGVSRATIQDGRIPHSILIELLSEQGVGTQFTN